MSEGTPVLDPLAQSAPSRGTGTEQSNPYVGPRALRPGEPIYGRGRELFELRNLLIAERIVLLYSPSGAGKTSLIQAGLLPEMVKEEFDVLPIMRVGKTTPAGTGNRYVASALRCLEENLPPDVAPLPANELGALSLAEYLETRKATLRWESTLLIFDQFEEILTTDPLDDEGKVEFFSQVGTVLRDSGRWALFSLREEYLAALDPYTRALPTRLKSTLRLDLLTDEGAREAIEKPAEARGVHFTPEATTQLVEDLRSVVVQSRDGGLKPRLGRYVEPVQLQVVCFGLWEKPRPKREEIGSGEITATGDVDSALGDYYAARIAKIARESGQKEKTLREWFDRSLITDAGLRSEVMKGEGASKEISETAIEQLQAAHLIRSEERPGATWLELSHDRLVRPIRADNTRWFQSHLSLLQQQATSWQRQNRNEALCLRGEALREARQWAKDHRGELTKTDEEFLTASAKEERVRSVQRIRQWAIAASVALVIAIGLTVYAWRQATIASARGMASLAYRLFDERLDLATLLAYEAMQKADLPETRDTVLAALLFNPRLTAFLHGHQTPAGALAFSADGKLLATGDYDGNIVFWNVATHRPERALKKFFTEAVRSIAFSSNGKFMAASSKNGSIVLRDLGTDQQILFPKAEGHTGNIWSVALSPGPELTLLASSAANDKVLLWNVSTLADPATLTSIPLPESGGDTRTVSFNASGSLVAAGYSDGSVRVWQKQEGNWVLFDIFFPSPVPEMDGKRGSGVSSVAFGPRGDNLLASGCSDWTVNVRDVPGRRNVAQGKHWGSIKSLAFSPNGALLVSAAEDSTLRLWEVPQETAPPILAEPQEPPPETATPLPALKMIERPLSGHVGWVLAVAFSPDGRTLASGGVDRKAILWDTEHVLPEGPNAGEPSKGKVVVALSPDAKLIAAAQADGRLLCRNWATGAEVAAVSHDKTMRSVGFSRNGRFMISSSSDSETRTGTVIVNDLAAPQNEPFRLEVPRRITLAALNHDGTRMAVAANGGVLLWDVQKREQIGEELKGLDADVVISSVAFSPDGKRVTAGGTNEFAMTWDIDTRTPIQQVDKHNGSVRLAAFSPDGKTLVTASGDNTLRLSDPVTGKSLGPPLTGHRGPVVALAFRADGKKLASGSEDKSVILWDLETQQQVAPRVIKHIDAVRSLEFSSDGKALLSVSSPREDPVVWNLDPASFVARAKARANRNMTKPEWQAHMDGQSYHKTWPDLPDASEHVAPPASPTPAR